MNKDLETIKEEFINWIEDVYIKEATKIQNNEDLIISFLEYVLMQLPYPIVAEDERADKLESRIFVSRHNFNEQEGYWIELNYINEALGRWNKNHLDSKIEKKSMYSMMENTGFIKVRNEKEDSIGIIKKINGSTKRGFFFFEDLTPENLKEALIKLIKINNSQQYS